jgi:hypothetical protein
LNWIDIAIAFQEDLEIIILDNGSSHESSAQNVLKNFEIPLNIKLVTNSINTGMLGNLFVGSHLGKSDYLWFVGDDDFVDSSKLPIIFEILKTNKFDLINLNYNLNTSRIDSTTNLQQYFESTIVTESMNYKNEGTAIELAGVTENFYTGIYAVIFKRYVGWNAYRYFGSKLFLSTKSCVPMTNYVITRKSDPITTFYINEKVVIANLNSSWHDNLLAWSIARIPEIHLQFLEIGTPKAAMLHWIKNHKNTFELGLNNLNELPPLQRSQFIEKFRIDMSIIDRYKEIGLSK